jgi:hypothetical protein
VQRVRKTNTERRWSTSHDESRGSGLPGLRFAIARAEIFTAGGIFPIATGAGNPSPLFGDTRAPHARDDLDRRTRMAVKLHSRVENERRHDGSGTSDFRCARCRCRRNDGGQLLRH